MKVVVISGIKGNTRTVRHTIKGVKRIESCHNGFMAIVEDGIEEFYFPKKIGKEWYKLVSVEED